MTFFFFFFMKCELRIFYGKMKSVGRFFGGGRLHLSARKKVIQNRHFGYLFAL